jgi:hypothetical protein
VGRLRGYGNAIVPQVAAEVIRAVMEADSVPYFGLDSGCDDLAAGGVSERGTTLIPEDSTIHGIIHCNFDFSSLD